MGKAADNERIKLLATRYNNLSVGLAIGGVLVPYLTLFQRMDDLTLELPRIVGVLLRGETDPALHSDIQVAFSFLAPIAVAFLLSAMYRDRAENEIKKIKG